MILKNKVVKNASWIVVCRIIQSLLGLLIGSLSARYLGPSNYGLVNYAASLASFAMPIMQLGLNAILVQEIVNAKNDEGEILGTALGLSFMSSLLCMGGIAAFSLIANRGETETVIVCVLYSVLLVFQALEMIQYWFQAKLRSKYTSITMLAAYAATSLYKIFLLLTQKNVYWFALSQAIDYGIIAIVLLVVYKKLGGESLKFSFTRIKMLLSKSHHYIIAGIMVTIFAQTDKIMLKFMMGDEATGYYSAACTCAGVTTFVFTAIIDSFQPVVLESKKIGQGSFEKNVVRFYAIIIYFSLIQCVGIALFSDLLVKILYGVEYLPAVNPLRLIVWYTTFSYLGSVRNIWMLAEGKQKYLWVINLCGAMMNVLLNFMLIPIMGVMGAALASLVTQIFTNVIMGFLIKNVRRNNYLMWKGCNPKVLIEMLKFRRKEDENNGANA